MNDLDRQLDDWGRQWRANQPAAARPDLSALRHDAQATRISVFGRRAATLVALVAILGIGATAALTLGGRENQSVNFHDGDPVRVEGALLEQRDGSVMVCTLKGGLLPAPAPPDECSSVAVRITGLDWSKVGQTQTDGSLRAVKHVNLHGRWANNAIEFIRLGDPSPASRPSNPCAADEGEGTGLGSDGEEQALRRLGAELANRPDRFSGLWRASSTDGLGRIVVGVIGNPSEERERLAGLYPYPLCLTEAQFTNGELEAAMRELTERGGDWRLSIDVPRNRVRVRVGFLDTTTQDAIRPWSQWTFIDELVQRDTDPN